MEIYNDICIIENQLMKQIKEISKGIKELN